MKRRSEAGQVLIQTALALTALMGFAGLAIDMGVLRYDKRLQQSAADAAAIAGASNIPFDGGAGIAVAAQDAATRNGFTDSGTADVSTCNGSSAAVGTVCVQVNRPPQQGPHSSPPDNNYVEVFVSVVQPTYFMKVFGFNSRVVTARAVATSYSGGNDDGCMYALNPASAGIEGVNVNGHATINATTCGIIDNGNFDTSGNAFTVNASTFSVSGTWNHPSQGDVTCSGGTTNCPQVGAPAASDPLSYLTPPCSPCTGGSAISISGNGGFSGTGVTYSNGVYTVSPGTYTSLSINGGTVNFAPGTYVFDGSGGLTIPGNSTITGTGVTFYFTNTATINVTGTPSIQLTAPTSGTYQGILMYQDPADTSTTFPNGPRLGGNSGSNFGGALYFPADQLTFFGNNSSYSAAMVVSGSVALSGNPTLNLSGNAGLPSGAIVKDATLVE